MSKRPAIFLDRDGVITEEYGYICQIERVKLFPYVKDCVDFIHKKGYYVFVITNQSGIARGIFTEQELLNLNERIRKKTGVDAIYYCPHHVQGKVKKYIVNCKCRKPGTDLIQQACREYKVDLGRSYLAGDRATDIKTGKNAGIKTILLNSGYGIEKLEESVEPDFIFQNLKEFVFHSGIL